MLGSGAERLPDDLVCLTCSTLAPTDCARALSCCHAWWVLREIIAQEQGRSLGHVLPPPAQRVALHAAPLNRTFIYSTLSAFHSLQSLESRVACRVDMSGSRFADLQYYVHYSDESGVHQAHAAWKEEDLRTHVTVLDGQIVHGYWQWFNGRKFLNLGPGPVPCRSDTIGEQHAGVDKLLSAERLAVRSHAAQEGPLEQHEAAQLLRVARALAATDDAITEALAAALAAGEANAYSAIPDADIVVTDADMHDPELLAELAAITGEAPPIAPSAAAMAHEEAVAAISIV